MASRADLDGLGSGEEKQLGVKLGQTRKQIHSSSGWGKVADIREDEWRVSDVRVGSHLPCFKTPSESLEHTGILTRSEEHG